MDKNFIIPARVYPDTEKGYLDAVEFDAYAWFESATDAQIAALDTAERRDIAQNAIAGDHLSPEARNDPRGRKTDILGSALGSYLLGRHALKWLESVAYGYASVRTFADRYPGVVFTESGATRFALTAGWILGIARGDRKVGLALAREFDIAFKNLSSELVDYEVRSQYQPDEVDGVVQIRRGKCRVSDDGTFAGFALAWYWPLGSNAVREKAKEIDHAAYTGWEMRGDEKVDLSDEETRRRWSAALDKATEVLRIAADLHEDRSYWPTYDVVTKEIVVEKSDVEGVESYTWTRTKHSCPTMSFVRVPYAFAYNGAMIYRGPGRTAEPFAVDFAGGERLWTVHT